MTIPPEDNMACVDVPITDDDIALEGDEEIRVTLDPPTNPDVMVDTDPSTITIRDDDGERMLVGGLALVVFICVGR